MRIDRGNVGASEGGDVRGARCRRRARLVVGLEVLVFVKKHSIFFSSRPRFFFPLFPPSPPPPASLTHDVSTSLRITRSQSVPRHKK